MINKYSLVLIAFLCSLFYGFGQNLFTNPINDRNPSLNNPYTTGQIVDANITVSGIGRSSGITGNNGNDRYNASGWNTASIDVNKYFYFTLTPNVGYSIDFVSFIYSGQRSNRKGPINISIRSSLDGYTNEIGLAFINGATIDLSSAIFQNITSSITFRVYAWGTNNAKGTFSINDFTFNGTITTLPCATTTTWDGSSWDNNAPSIITIAVINGDYDTNIYGNIEACKLTVNSGNTLNIRNSNFVKVQKDVNIDGTIIVQTQGALVQIDDEGTFTLNTDGLAKVIKNTANLNHWYEYTYWSSPVKNETVENAFPDTPIDRRFLYNAKNYLDQTMEVGNNDVIINGQDDIDDDGDDWQIASGVMEIGLGYAATSSPFGMFPNIDQATFSGAFNTGDVEVWVYKNDLEIADNNWNLIGNPYPSAISVDAFLDENMSVLDENVPFIASTNGVSEGAIFLWSQNSEPSRTNNGNESLNFAQSDYAIINLTTELAGGDGVTPNRYIPSGQSFFISYDHDAKGTPLRRNRNIKRGKVTFTNAMRMADATSNSQFFRGNSNNDNKLWLNLTSDNGIFSQAAVAYVDGATNEYDGFSYDAPRNLSTDVYSLIYTSIEGNNMKFAIQGKNTMDLNLNEVIVLGFDTSIDVPTLYTLSIAQFEGKFFTDNTVYLIDNAMNIVHDLSKSNYAFTSEIGEYSDRFEIVFTQEALHLGDDDTYIDSLSIIEHDNGEVQFKLSSPFKMKSIEIIDLLGRTLYRLQANGNSILYNLSNLSQATYIAKIELSNGIIITKKATKRK